MTSPLWLNCAVPKTPREELQKLLYQMTLAAHSLGYLSEDSTERREAASSQDTAYEEILRLWDANCGKEATP